MFKKGSLLRRRPSASMIVAIMALFVALSGGAYAAGVIPNNSVGSDQLKANAVTFNKLANNAVNRRNIASKAVINSKIANNAISYNQIKKGEIGHARVAQSQIQWRVTGKCAGEFAIQSITDTGGVTCSASLPSDYSTAGLNEPLTSTSTVLASQSLPTGSAYMVSATPYVQVKGTAGAQNVTVSCELVAGTITQTRNATIALNANHEQATASIPLEVDMPAASAAQQAAVACTTFADGTTATAPAVQAASSMDALQLSAINVATTPGTSTTPFTLTTPTTTTPTTTTATTPAA